MATDKDKKIEAKPQDKPEKAESKTAQSEIESKVTDSKESKEVKDDKKDDKKTTTKAVKKSKNKVKRQVPSGRAYVHATYNNTIVTITDQHGNALGQGSAGQVGFRGPKKATPYASSQVVRKVVDQVRDYGVKNVSVFVKGVGSGREGAIRALNSNGLNILSIKDITPFPHNGCRPKKPRRV
ncbi:30S ribosomal protein S11 [bacterium]|nr:30S ribosomal protein S11 [bacterium]|tara:strand:+ start:1532 stop:2077 length:546 start_codon:yes stop_codon:yes gene_type:complete